MAGAGAVGTAVIQEKSVGTALDDATASSEIKTKLLSEDRKRFGEVDVEVANGLVLLSFCIVVVEVLFDSLRHCLIELNS